MEDLRPAAHRDHLSVDRALAALPDLLGVLNAFLKWLFFITGFISLVAVLVGLFSLFIWVGPVGLVFYLSLVLQSNQVTEIVTYQVLRGF